ncbi:MAG: hypothetical protein M0P64_04335 [Candidatus Pacebacteria bacterium]|jgi:hypothetical protein|nr:hypothetical protein [Candidatus Paceibacterota bacterium]
MMLTDKDKEEIEKMRLISEIESEIGRLNIQHRRIFESTQNDAGGPTSTHEADFYMVLLRRLYRRIEANQHDSRVANLKGRFSGVHKKIKMRDDFEHDINYETFPHVVPGIIVIGGVVINGDSSHILSGDQQWFLKEDHDNFINLMREFAGLYPFVPKPKKEGSSICRCCKK